MSQLIHAWRSVEMGTQQIVYIAVIVCMIIALLLIRKQKSWIPWIVMYGFQLAFGYMAWDGFFYYNEASGFTLGKFMTALMAGCAIGILVLLSVGLHICLLVNVNEEKR